MEALFEFLFKYRPALFAEGELGIAAGAAQLALASALLVGGVVLVVQAWRRSDDGLRTLLAGLRLGALLVVCAALARPVLVLFAVVPQQSFVAVLADDSRSMGIRDQGEGSRGDWIRRELGLEGTLRSGLESRFQVRTFAVGGGARRIESAAALGFAEGRTALGRSLDEALGAMAGVPLSGIVLLTDGAQNQARGFEEAVLRLRARGVPVYPVALGRERYRRDLEIRSVEVPRRILSGSTVEARIGITQEGFGGREARFEVRDGRGRILESRDVSLPVGATEHVVSLPFQLTGDGAESLGFAVVPPEGDAFEGNDQRQVLVEVLDERQKILYFEGEPRHEVGFLRRAVAPDQQLQLVSLVRLADNRFYRLEVDSGDELADGFPRDRAELFRYRGLVLGSVPANFFTYDQMRMLVDFASRRGGGVLFLGGSGAFGEGGWAGTPLAELMPVVLSSELRAGSRDFYRQVSVEPTPAGETHPVLQLPSGAAWPELPALSTINRLDQTKPSATSLLMGRGEGGEDAQVVLAHHRFGRGKAVVFSAQDSWKWQMLMPLEDQSHGVFWRQMMRWLVADVEAPVTLQALNPDVAEGESVELQALVRDERFLEVNRATVEATVTGPDGEQTVVPMTWVVDQDGDFRGRFAPPEPGVYRAIVEASAEGEALGRASTVFQVGLTDAEAFGTRRNTELLERLAAETGGAFYEPSAIDNLVEDLSYSREGVTTLDRRDLWNMPILLLLLLTLLSSEWLLRRWRGLP